MNVVFASSNEYVPFLLIALTSFLEHNENEFDSINVFILDNKITDKNKKKILDLTNNFSCNISFIELNIFDNINIDLSPVELKSTVSLMTYARLFISSILPNNVKKILYLDCDAIILGSFKDLWNLNLEDNYCAAVLEPGANECLKRTFWIYDVESYINGGLLLINLEKWREDNVEKKFLDFLLEHQGKFFVADQGVINHVFNTKIKIIEPKYNLLLYFQFCDYEIAKMCCGIETEYYSKEIVDDSRKNPVFVHFAGEGYMLPWHNKYHKYNPDFVRYAKKTNSEELIQYMDAPTLQSKLFFSNNKFFYFILKLIPSIVLIKFFQKRMVNILKQRSI